MTCKRHNIFSGCSCDAKATEPKIPRFVDLFYDFVTGWILEMLRLRVRAVRGHSQSNPTLARTAAPVPGRPGGQIRSACRWAHLLVTPSASTRLWGRDPGVASLDSGAGRRDA